ncbi:MAG TPA: hypothetical protein VL598_12915 [Trinickia sp.]|jgi:cytosine/adenosine deaminase-related metal-dependent hydrolase|uniref:hypothetical protein n=1 Tax=Trinickia sp. TaxID=2571163 RepID=UPI002BFBC273|nr:hypothetical protein [Trinickia sp.]HTI18560.1 hypothetical protein [Trinickia sp.]
MNALEMAGAGNAEWAIVDTLYFDAAVHSFVMADIEIDGSRIGAILPPATSKRKIRLRGERSICLPGFIDPDVGPIDAGWGALCRNLVLSGITTAGTFCATHVDLERVGSTEGIRRFCYVEWGEQDPCGGMSDTGQAACEGFERAARTVNSGRCELFPAIVPGKTWSAATLLAAAKAADRLRRRLCIKLCANEADAQAYRETRFCTELGLLAYLSLLANTTIFNLSQISRSDTHLLDDSRANLICAPGAVSEWLMGRAYAPLSVCGGEIGFSSYANIFGDADRFASLLSFSMALIKKSCEVDAGNLVADALTRSAAMALGIEDLGMIAANMKADLCIFDRPCEVSEKSNSLDLLNLVASQKPRHVLVDGTPVVIEGACVHEMVES